MDELDLIYSLISTLKPHPNPNPGLAKISTSENGAPIPGNGEQNTDIRLRK